MATTPQPTTQLWLSSGNGPISRTILNTPLRDAQPSEIPLISVSDITSPSLAARTAVAQQIRRAAMTNGFFYMTDHGIPADLTAAAHMAGLAFFRRPAAAKEPANTARSQYHKYTIGWKPAATLRINPFESADMRESFAWRYDPRYDPAVGAVEDVPAEVARNLRFDEDGFPWSKTRDVPELEEAVVKCWQAVLGLGRALVRSMALSLGLEEDAFDAKFTHPDAAVALNYYPSLEGGEGEGRDVSIGSHTDFQLFTILWQDEVGGLQVLDREGQWLRAKPIPGTFVVNFADYMQRITNDRYLSTVHRVQNASGKERLSMAFFFGFNLNESCGVLDTCVEPGEEKKYDEISCQEWTRRRLRAMHTKAE